MSVACPKGPVDPEASRAPSGDRARQEGQVVSACLPFMARKHIHRRMSQICKADRAEALKNGNAYG